MKVLFYGPLADLLGPEMDLEGRSADEIREEIARAHPAAADAISRSKVFVGGEMVHGNQPLQAEAVEFLPPVSGG